MSVYNDLEAELHSLLATLPNCPPIAWPNSGFDPVVGEVYLRPTLLPAASNLFTLDRMQEHRGIYQVDVYAPLGRGVKTLSTWLDNIETLFKNNISLTANSTTVYIQQSGRSQYTRQDNFFVGHISINYLCYSF